MLDICLPGYGIRGMLFCCVEYIRRLEWLLNSMMTKMLNLEALRYLLTLTSSLTSSVVLVAASISSVCYELQMFLLVVALYVETNVLVCKTQYWHGVCACMLCGTVQMADAPTVAEAQPLPPALLIAQSLYLLQAFYACQFYAPF